MAPLEMCRPSPDHGLRSLWDMLKNYFPIYQLALDLQVLRSKAELRKGTAYQLSEVAKSDIESFYDLLQAINQKGLDHSLIDSSELAKHLLGGSRPENYADM